MSRSLSVDRSRWVSHLGALIKEVLHQIPFSANEDTRRLYIESFQDEFGNRRASDRAFLAHLLGVSILPDRPRGSMALDEQLWWCVATGSDLPANVISVSDGLIPAPDSFAIEYRTMIELGSLHAFWAIALHSRNTEQRLRALHAARWHIEELQPDNAINRPWGLPVFIELAVAETDVSIAQTAELHAQTLLHNACINFGKPDLLSALILKDAIDLLKRADQCADF